MAVNSVPDSFASWTIVLTEIWRQFPLVQYCVLLLSASSTEILFTKPRHWKGLVSTLLGHFILQFPARMYCYLLVWNVVIRNASVAWIPACVNSLFFICLCLCHQPRCFWAGCYRHLHIVHIKAPIHHQAPSCDCWTKHSCYGSRQILTSVPDSVLCLMRGMPC